MVCKSRSFLSMDCGTLALDDLRMLTKEEQMEPEKTCTSNDTTEKMKLYMAMELSQKEWKLGFSVGLGQAPRLLAVAGRNLYGLMNEIRLTREQFGLGEDSASIELSRRFRRVKKDWMDASRLLGNLMSYIWERRGCGAWCMCLA